MALGLDLHISEISYVVSVCQIIWYPFNITVSACVGPFPSVRQHPSYGDFLEIKRKYYQNCSVLDCVTHCLQSATHMSSSYRSNRLGLSHWDPYAVRRGGCLELYSDLDDQLVSFSALTLLVWSSGL